MGKDGEWMGIGEGMKMRTKKGFDNFQRWKPFLGLKKKITESSSFFSFCAILSGTLDSWEYGVGLSLKTSIDEKKNISEMMEKS